MKYEKHTEDFSRLEEGIKKVTRWKIYKQKSGLPPPRQQPNFVGYRLAPRKPRFLNDFTTSSSFLPSFLPQTLPTNLISPPPPPPSDVTVDGYERKMNGTTSVYILRPPFYFYFSLLSIHSHTNFTVRGQTTYKDLQRLIPRFLYAISIFFCHQRKLVTLRANIYCVHK